MGTEIVFEPGSIAWTGAWLITVALGAAICFAQRDWLFALTEAPESERKPLFATFVAAGIFLSAVPGYFLWLPFLAVEVGWLLHPLLKPWLAGATSKSKS